MPRGTRRHRLPRSRGTNITPRKQREIESDEYKLFTYQKTCFKCVALVQLSDLSIGCDAGRLIDDQQNVVRLKRTLRSQGCYRLSNAFHVPVVIDVADWDAGRVWLQQSTLGPAQSLRLRQLRKSPDYTLLALDQESLITAARARFRELGEENPWWIVDVYVTASGHPEPLDEELIRSLRENFHKERFPSDGRIYQSIRAYQGVTGGRRNHIAENFWWAVLQSEPGGRKADYLRALPQPLADAFDALLPIKGLWADMSIGVLHKLRAMRCNEVTPPDPTQPIICYLKYIERVFYDLVGGQVNLLFQIDAVTVRLLQSRAPGVSARDLSFLQQKQTRLFKHIDSQRERDAIWQRMERIQLPIPTLKTFFQDILFLDVGQSVMRQLCRNPLTAGRSIDEALEEQYIVDSGGSRPDQSTIPGNQFRSGLWDLWRFSLQFAFEMTTQKDHHRRVPRKMEDIERAQELGLHEIHLAGIAPSLRLHLFRLARSYGIHSPVSADSPETAPLDIPLPVPSDFPPEQDKDLDLERRCGKPFTDSIEADRYALSLESLSQPTTGTRVSAVSVRQSIFSAFFRYLLPQETASQDGSRSGREYDARVTAGSGSLNLAPEPHEIVHPSPVRPPRTAANPELLQPSSNPNLVGPFPHLEQSHSVRITHFRFEIIIFQTMRVILLPYNRDALNAFFEQLNEYEFHFYFSPDEEGYLLRQEDRTIPYLECYPLYINFPFSTLRAVYCQGCPIHPVHSLGYIMGGQATSREEMADVVRTLVQTAIGLVLDAPAGTFDYNGF
ncbi:unnamed protein product [Penicillium salamii]|uniref:Uncharacterized protein n=1 Tax=Penicillium salamii TaxID=1612424 RepID=A0A9W4K4D0_9EURO|nr:unnamed protein product [Penicillium salamii]CAG8287319.1 unnamed protein product [Penicillium salamii]CAG8306567.1 unnamed protein product [Penicillium salamii]CAG8307908.1 unnamed protein product [Penicillium salamii]CAG8313209.1 unnamed protein product [Penicillium salamii]